MSTLFTALIAANADDGSYDTIGPGVDPDGTTVAILDSSPNTAWLRFTGVTIPKLSVITACTISVLGSGGGSSVSLTVQAETGSSPTAPTTAADGAGRIRTTASVSKSLTVLDPSIGAPFDITGLAAVLQELVNQTAWSSGSTILLFLQYASAGPFGFQTKEAGNPPSISITYNAPATASKFQRGKL